MGKITLITEEEKQLVKFYHSKEYNDKAIMEATGLSYNKVYYIRHILLNLPAFNNKKTVAKNAELILKYYRQQIPIKRISSLLNIGVWSIRKFLNEKGIVKLHSNLKTIKSISKREKSIVIGTLLGDSTLYLNPSSKNNNARLSFRHCRNQKIYSEYLYNNLKSLNPKIKTVFVKGHFYKDREFKDTYQIEVKTSVHKFLTELKNAFYLNGKKVLNFEYINKYYTAESLAIHFMDDGSKSCDNNGKINGFIISMENFTFEEINNFSYFLLGRFQLQSSVIKSTCGYILRISSKSVDRFISIVKPYITSDLLYKISSNKTS